MKRFRLADDVVYRSFGSETVLLNLKTGQYHGVRGSGGRMLEVLAETGDVQETAQVIADEYEQPVSEVTKDVVELCQAMAERSLVRTEDEGPRE
jgi:hypothetical protein